MENKKRIVLVSHNDVLGGAAIVTYRLMKTLRDMGHDAKMLVTNKLSDDPNVVLLGNPISRHRSFITERLGIFVRNDFNRRDLFKVSTGSTGISIINHPLVKEADAILLNWVNQGTISLREIARLGRSGKKIIWTMHDMWCMTGICHHAYECNNFTDSCGRCRFLGNSSHSKDLSYRTWKKKKKLFAQSDIQFVAVSNWVKEKAKSSSILRDKKIYVIPPAFQPDKFNITLNSPTIPFTHQQIKHVITFGAAKLDDRVKGLPYAIESLNIFMDKYPELAAGTVAVFFGTAENPKIFDTLRMPHVVYGTITNHATLQQLYCCSTVILSTSLYESFGMTLLEGMSCGAIPVSFGQGGQTDIINHMTNGYIAQYLNTDDVAEGIRWAYEANIPPQQLHDYVEEKFGARNIANRYLALLDD